MHFEDLRISNDDRKISKKDFFLDSPEILRISMNDHLSKWSPIFFEIL